MTSFFTNAKKPLIFLFAAGLGCFIAAILAEPLFIPPPLRYTPPPAPGAKFCFTFDDSGSMSGGKRKAVKQAAKDFVNPRDLDNEKIAIVVFSDSSRIFLPLSRDKNQIISTIDSYSDGGGTYFTKALQHSIDVFQNDADIDAEEKQIAEVNEKITEQNAKDEKRGLKRPPMALQRIPKIVLFFTDGQNADQADALKKAVSLREKGILLYAISTLDGDKNYLAQMTSDPSRVFMTSDQNIADTCTVSFIPDGLLVLAEGSPAHNNGKNTPSHAVMTVD